ncbi:S8 family serine peptidase [Paenibacillus sp. CF384]|uniref:S8 family serine peptidase n=1 Tax=Paenibacillus sp. CF384 TaxID=1884382 RepID=UPI0008942A4D|nr:S8 family serine peptidase [Paenibacillus sp. CF384]SDX73616.1 S-layer homology domain-containing protein [Paenibacillus sp. CF384]
MANLLVKRSVALLSAALLVTSPFSGITASAEAKATLADVINPSSPLFPAALKSNLAALQALTAASSTGPATIDSDLDTTSNAKINVIVQLSSQPISVAKYASELTRRSFSPDAAAQAIKKEHASFLSTASSKGVAMTVNYQYDTVLNGMEVTITANQIPKLAQMSGVKAISKNRTYFPIPLAATPEFDVDGAAVGYYDINPIKQIGADVAWTKGWTGKGVKVGVIDTGVDYLHPDLKDAYKGGYDSVNKDNDPYEDLPDIGYNFPGSEHGTHVSGTIVGRAAQEGSDIVQKGIAYEAELHSYKVLGAKLDPITYQVNVTGSSAEVIDGIEHAIEDHMDVINMSLGSDMEKSPNSPDSIAVNNAVLSGVIAVVANGNAAGNPYYYYSMGSPASAQLGISVAAATSVSSHFSGSFAESFVTKTEEPPVPDAQEPQESQEPQDAQEVQAVEESLEPQAAATSLDAIAWPNGASDFNNYLGGQTFDAVYVGLGDYGDYDVDVEGKVVLISRGTLSFVDKIKIARERKAKAVILFNGNALNGTAEADLSEHIEGRDGKIGSVAYLGENSDFLPTFDMSGLEGRALAKRIIDPANDDKDVKFTFGADFPETVVPGDQIADFSSRGPNSDGNYGIKPDISAPGVNILSTWPAYGEKEFGYPVPSYKTAYYRISGTSMAAPHIAGLAALMKQQHPEWTPRDVRAALANTSDTIHDLEGTQYDVYSQGAGRADVADAIETPAIVEAMDEIKIYDEQLNENVIASEASSLSFGTLEPGAEALTKPLRVKNLSEASVTYTASVLMHDNVTSDPTNPMDTPDVTNIEVELGGLDANGSTITADALSSQPFTLSAKAKDEEIDGVYEGEIRLEADGLPTLHLPFVIHVGDDENNNLALRDLTLSSQRITPDQPIDVSATLADGDMNYAAINVYNLDEEYVGTLAYMYDSDEELTKLNPLPTGELKFEKIDGGYSSETVDENGFDIIQKLPEGKYVLDLVVAQFDEYNEVKKVQSAGTMIVVDDGDGSNDIPTDPSDPGDGGGAGGGEGETGGHGGHGGTDGGFGGGVPTEAAVSETLNAVVPANGKLASVTGAAVQQGDTAAITVTDADLQKALDDAKGAPVVVSVNAASGNVTSSNAQLVLTDAQVKLLQSAAEGSVVAFTWKDASVSIPVSVLKAVGTDAKFILEIKPSADSKSVFAKGYADTSVLGTPYAFEAYSLSNGVKTPVVLQPDQGVRRAFLLDAAIDTSHAGALYTDGGSVYPVPATFNKTTDGRTIVTITRPGFSVYAVAVRKVSFTDTKSSWAAAQIQTLADKFILNGTSATTFSPKSAVTRAQFTSMLVNAIGLNKQAGTSPFSDVKGTDWFAQDVIAAYKAGLITGSGGAFKPNDQITRQDLTVMLARAVKLLHIKQTSGTPDKPYADASKFGAYSQASIQTVTAAGLMQGVEKHGQLFFDPTLPTTREAAAKVLYQLLTAGHLI